MGITSVSLTYTLCAFLVDLKASVAIQQVDTAIGPSAIQAALVSTTGVWTLALVDVWNMKHPVLLISPSPGVTEALKLIFLILGNSYDFFCQL